ncbi:MAG: UDP-3-O-acyl-N-acetylglucosamine deacetylase [Fibrobacteraceae bacterium]
MKQLFETELSSVSLSLPFASAKIVCRKNLPPGVEWFASSGELLWNTNEPDTFKALQAKVCRTSILVKDSENSLSSMEHLSPVFLLYPEYFFEVHAHQKELPILDGSAYPWYAAIRSLAGTPQNLLFYDAPIRCEWKWNGGFCSVCPAETLEVEYSIFRNGYEDSAYVAFYDAEDLVKIFPARTFIFEDDFNKAREAGLLSAVDNSCGLLLKTNSLGLAEPLIGGPLRMEQEPVIHKILDLVGDLSLPAPFLPKLRIRIHNGGHVAHRQLLERLLEYVFRNAPQI